VGRHRPAKRAHLWGALFVWLTWISTSSVLLSPALAPAWAAAGECRADHIDEIVRVAFVYDGDTVKLSDGRKVRLAGINAPEISHHGKAAEPLGEEARAFVVHLLPGDGHLQLRFERQRQDRYGRLLAHLYLMNGDSIEERLLAKGLAQQLVIPPNGWQSSCYQQVERKARHLRLGIWRNDYYRPVGAPQPDDVGKFLLINGAVAHLNMSRKSLWLTLDSGVVLRIPGVDLPQFDGVDIRGIIGRSVVARGWLRYEHNHYQLTVRHPSALLMAEQW
jgi:micrococcal nuclease